MNSKRLYIVFLFSLGVFSLVVLWNYLGNGNPLDKSRAYWVYENLLNPSIPLPPSDFSGIDDTEPPVNPPVPPTPTVIDDTEYAKNEYKLLKPIYDAYIANKDYEGYKQTYNPAYNYSSSQGDPVGIYRNLCTQITLSSIINNGKLTANSPEVKYLADNYNSDKFRGYFEDSQWWWISNAAAFDCLIAASSVRDVLPTSVKNQLLSDIAYGAKVAISGKSFVNSGTPMARTSANFKAMFNGWSSTWNSPIEEAGTDASFMFAAAYLLPKNGAGSITDAERAQLISQAKDLVKFSVERCSNGCPYTNEQWLTINHGLDPNPNYTLSGLTQYTEIAMILNQLGVEADSDLFTSSVKSGVKNITNALMVGYNKPGLGAVGPYINANYGFSGSFYSKDILGNIYDGATLPISYDKLTNTFVDNRTSVNSSIPVSDVDSMNQYLIPGDNYLKSYTYKGNKIYHFECDLKLPLSDPARCTATYILTLADLYKNITKVSGSNWDKYPITTSAVDSVTQYFIPGTKELRTLVYYKDRVWMYKCLLSKPGSRWVANCSEGYTMSLSDHWATIKGDWTSAGWTGANVPPTSGIDNVSQVINDGTTTIKGYIFKASQVWAFQCDGIGTAAASCYPMYTKALSGFWDQITGGWDKANWTTNALPTAKVDSFYQYYLFEDPAQLYGYIVSEDKLWSYGCKNSSCSARYVNAINDSFTKVNKKYRWPYDNSEGFFQISGVTDWGMDATFQNSAFAAMAYLNSSDSKYYENLINAQISKGQDKHTGMPSNYSGGNWSWTPLSKTSPAGTFAYLTDGWNSPIGFVADQPNSVRINATWSINMLSAKNHSTSYLLFTKNKILKAF